MTLAEIILDLYRIAEQNPARRARRVLNRGLELTLKLEPESGLTRLWLSRGGEVYPSSAEVEAVRRAWPYPLPRDLNLTSFTNNGKKFFVMHWATPKTGEQGGLL
jgi:hypothetical protein